MFLTRSQRIVTGSLLALWYGTIVILFLLVLTGLPAVAVLAFWATLVLYVATKTAMVRPRRRGL